MVAEANIVSETNGQLSLIEAESDEALLIPRDHASKRYTARTVDKIELKRNYILDLIAFGLPLDAVAQRAGCSRRVVQLLGAKYSQVVASDARKFAQVLKNHAAKFLFIASEKAADAKFGELMVGVGIASQRAQEMELGASAMSQPDDGAIELETENPALVKAREFLEKRRGGATP